MLCTLQEAYNVPSFDVSGKKKRSCAAPDSRSQVDAYDPFVPELGRGEKASIERFQATRDKSLSQEETPIAYRSKTNDYDYYKQQYGIDMPKVEGFQGGDRCPPPSPQAYNVPITDESKRAYQKAIATSLEDGGSTQKHIPEPPAPRVVDMSKVSGYYDEDLEKYLQTKEMRAAPVPSIPLLTTTSRIVKTEETSPVTVDPKVSSTIISDESWQSFWDLFLFIFAGILVMFLCDQLFKLALMIGMKRTVEILEPYLK
jgi:hypothetical protein